MAAPAKKPKTYKESCSILIVNRNNQVLLQLRDNIPGILSPNMIATFGGGIEPGETPEEAMYRETAEELDGYRPKKLVHYKILQVGDVTVHVFLAYDPDFNISEHKVTEGQKALFVGEKDLDNPQIMPYLRKYLKKFFKEIDTLQFKD